MSKAIAYKCPTCKQPYKSVVKLFFNIADSIVKAARVSSSSSSSSGSGASASPPAPVVRLLDELQRQEFDECRARNTELTSQVSLLSTKLQRSEQDLQIAQSSAEESRSKCELLNHRLFQNSTLLNLATAEKQKLENKLRQSEALAAGLQRVLNQDADLADEEKAVLESDSPSIFRVRFFLSFCLPACLSGVALCCPLL